MSNKLSKKDSIDKNSMKKAGIKKDSIKGHSAEKSRISRFPTGKGCPGNCITGDEKPETGNTRTGRVHTELAGEVIEYLLAAVLILLCVVVPLYAKDGYHQIGNAKFEAYRRIMAGGFSVLTVLAAVYSICRLIGRRAAHRKAPAGSAPLYKSLRERISVTDLFVLAYLLLTGVSVVSGGFYEDALWGAYGWNMGFLSQASFVLLYLFLSRFGRYYRAVLAALCSAAAVVFCIGILHRLLIDPIGFYDGLTNEQKAQFLSTLGQATWYAAFLAVTLPVGMGVFLYTAQKKLRVAAGIYMTAGFCTLVTQNSDSAYFALAGMLTVFFMVSCEKKEMLCRFMAALTLFFASGKFMYLLMRIRTNPALEPDFITQLIWTSRLTWGLLAVCLLTALWLHRSGAKAAVREKRHRPEGHPPCKVGQEASGRQLGKRNAGEDREQPETAPATARLLRRGLIGIVSVLTIAVVLLICLQSKGALPAGISEKAAAVSYLNWGDDWGNGRGRIWKFACRMLSEETIRHRIFGIGPDCFNSYVTAFHGEEAALLWGEKQLTNAHNEWLNILINGGILGAAAYVGIYASAAYRFLRYREKNFLLTAIGAAVVSYMCYNFFCYQQVLCTPFIFILMGAGEYMLRHQE